MIRSNSLPPATLAPCDGTMNGSPAAARSAVAGIAESAVTAHVGTPFIWKFSAVWSFISFSIHEPDGYMIASWARLHCACAWVNCVPPPPGCM